MVDPLTGLLNREYFDRFASKEMALAERTGLSLTFFMIQVHGSESLNDHSKHAAGDRVLLGVAELLRKTFRGSDTVVRYSEEEFVASMPGCNEQQAQGAAERFRAQVDRWNQENTDEAHRMSLRYSTAAYANGNSFATLMGTLRQKMRDLQCVQADREMAVSSETEKSAADRH
jgi:diguanylate cyclase (GGDEF)-like protein